MLVDELVARHLIDHYAVQLPKQPLAAIHYGRAHCI